MPDKQPQSKGKGKYYVTLKFEIMFLSLSAKVRIYFRKTFFESKLVSKSSIGNFLTMSLSAYFCLSLSHTHTHTHTRNTISLSLSLLLSLTHACTYKHTNTHTHTRTHTHIDNLVLPPTSARFHREHREASFFESKFDTCPLDK